MRPKLIALQALLRPLIQRAKYNNEAVSKSEGQVRLTISTFDFNRLEVFSNLLWGSWCSWEGEDLDTLLKDVEEEIKVMVEEQMSFPRSFLVDFD